MIQLTFDIIENNKLPRGKIILNDNVLHNNFYDFTTFDIKPNVGSNILQITLDNKIEKEDIYILKKDNIPTFRDFLIKNFEKSKP